MYPSSIKLLFAISIFFFFFFAPSFSNSVFPSTNITLFGDALLNSSSVILTKEKSCTTHPPPQPPFFPPSATSPSTVGRAFYTNPLRFLDPSSNATASFYCSFCFTITNTDSCPFGDGFAFLITPTMTSFSLENGYMGLPSENEASSDQDSYVAVEFDTNFDLYLEDINGNHVGIDVDMIKSVASVDVNSRGVDLKNGKEMTAWIEYRHSEYKIKIWLWYANESRPIDPILVAPIDLSKQFKEFMYVGFTASNGKGSSIHSVKKWRFKTFFGNPPPSNTTPMDIVKQGAEDCLMCPPRNPNIEIGSYDYNRSNRRVLNLALVLGGFAVAVILIAALVVGFCVCLVKRRRLRRAQSEIEMRRFHGGRMVPQMLSLNEIKSATNGFNQDKIIGEGASAVVYEGAIPSCGSVAVKRFNHENRFDSSISHIPFNTEFATMVGCLRHKNLVQLQGWCCERNELVLVYEHMANGSLDKILHNRTNLTKFLTWERRLNIIRGVASALIYLHEECENQIIHRDVKTCNILLDSDFNAKLGDFGLAEVYRRSTIITRYATVPAGTMGYLAPEYVFSGVPTVKTDVYSFGVVVLEVATGRRPVDEDRVVITDYVWDLWEKGAIGEAADANLIGGFKSKEMERTLMVGLCCAHPDCEKRPTMREAARMLRWESRLPVLPAKKPTMRIQSVPLDSMSLGGDFDETTPWSTPRTHFSRIN